MQIKYFRGTWGMDLLSLEGNLHKIKAGGFDGVETSLPVNADEKFELRSLLGRLELELIVQVHTRGNSPQEHIRSLEEQYRAALEFNPLWVNAHTGNEFFTFEENLSIFRRAQELEGQSDAPVLHETHRGRALYSLPAANAVLEALPGLKLTADFSHWCCVHESLLQERSQWLVEPIRRSRLIHARVGHAEGPQVGDPRAPEWAGAVEAHLAWWQAIVDHNLAEHAPVLAITPEFGPPAYMQTLPFTQQPVASLWDINLYMMELLKQRLVV